MRVLLSILLFSVNLFGKDTAPTPAILRWDSLNILSYQKRQQYLLEVQKIFSDYKPKNASNHELRHWAFIFASHLVQATPTEEQNPAYWLQRYTTRKSLREKELSQDPSSNRREEIETELTDINNKIIMLEQRIQNQDRALRGWEVTSVSTIPAPHLEMPRNRTRKCLEAGEVFVSDRQGICFHPHKTEFCGKEYGCENRDHIPCNPLIYGFKEKNYLEHTSHRSVIVEPYGASKRFFLGASGKKVKDVLGSGLGVRSCETVRSGARECSVIRSEISVLQQRLTGLRPGHRLHENVKREITTLENELGTCQNTAEINRCGIELYKSVHCVPKENSNQSCAAAANSTSGFNLARMFLDMKEKKNCEFYTGKDLKTKWNEFANNVESICMPRPNTECTALLTRARLLTQVYLKNDGIPEKILIDSGFKEIKGQR